MLFGAAYAACRFLFFRLIFSDCNFLSLKQSLCHWSSIALQASFEC
jgi:hypothetical protein